MIKPLSQRDPKWSLNKLGISDLTVGRYGCTTTCISMLSEYFKCYQRPDQLATKTLNYTKDGLILWKSIDNLAHMKFEKRLYGRNDAEIMESLKDPNKAVIFEVERRHWVTAIRKNRFSNSYKVIDPWFGDYCRVDGRYKGITGSAHFITK